MSRKKHAFLNLYLIILSIVLLFQSCFPTEESSSDCDKQFLNFKFDYHMGDNDFVGEIDVIGLYFFDKQDNFLEVIPVKIENLGESNHEVELYADYQDCKIVAWAGLSQNNNQIEYPSMNDSDSIGSLTFKLKTELGNISPDSLDPMFFGGQELLTFPDNNGTTQTLSFLRNNNVIKFSIVTIDGDIIDLKNDHEARIYAPNGHYTSNNGIVENTPLITYHSVSNDIELNVVTFNTLRLNEIYSDETKLFITNKETGLSILYDKGVGYLRLIDLLIKRKPSPAMPNQEYLDRESAWDMEIIVEPIVDEGTYVVLGIIINDWIVTDDVDIPDFE